MLYQCSEISKTLATGYPNGPNIQCEENEILVEISGVLRSGMMLKLYFPAEWNKNWKGYYPQDDHGVSGAAVQVQSSYSEYGTQEARALSLLSYNMAMDGHCDRTRSVDRASPTTPSLTPHPSPLPSRHPTAETRTVIANVSI